MDDHNHAAWLGNVTGVLAGVRDLDAALREVARLCVPAYADLCIFDVVGLDGSARRVAAGTSDPDREAALEELAASYPSGPRSIATRAMEARAPCVYERVDAALIAATATDARHRSLLERLGIRSALTVPILRRDRCLGAISLGYARDERRYGERDVARVQELAERAAAAIENAQLFAAAEAARRIAETEHARLDAILRAAPAIVCILQGPERVIEFANERFRALFPGRPLVGLRAADALAGTGGGGFGELVERVRETGVSLEGRELEVLLHPEDPEPRFFDFSCQPLASVDGRLDRVVVFAHEVTALVRERRKAQALADDLRVQRAELLASETRYRTLVQATAQVVWSTDAEGRPKPDASSWGAFTGQSLDEERDDRFAPIHPDDRPRLLEAFREALAAEAPLEIEHRLRRHDGVYRTMISRALPVRGDDGRVREWVGACTDVTEARDADRRKDEFLAILGHELRNPLAPIRTALEVLNMRAPEPRSGPRDDERAHRRAISVIERQVEHMARLVDDLLDVSRITRGVVELRRERLELAAVVARAVEIACPLLEQRSHVLRVDVPERGLLVDADPTRLAQVFANLLTNAARYTPAGGRVEIAARTRGRAIEIAVADDGVGLDADLLPRVFEAFVQGPRSLDRAPGGLGLGLSLVRSLVSLHGGTVTAHSEGSGKGSTFVVSLPRAEAPARADESDRALRAAPISDRRLRVLLVDDNPDLAELLGEALRTFDHDVRTALDGPSAIAAAEAFGPDVALLDLGLPVMDGYELAKQLRSRDQRVRLIALTGYGQDKDRAKSREAGFDVHLVKPVDLDVLERTIEKLAPISRAG